MKVTLTNPPKKLNRHIIDLACQLADEQLKLFDKYKLRKQECMRRNCPYAETLKKKSCYKRINILLCK